MQTDNLQDSNPESVEEQVMDNNLDTNDFFERLDNEVNGAIYDEVVEPQPEIEQQTSQLENPVSENAPQAEKLNALMASFKKLNHICQF